ncbi:serine O-acetyltransferase EpsC [Candidatus Poribacteria bacterium]
MRKLDQDRCSLRHQLPDIVDETVNSYHRIPSTHNIGESILPSKPAIIEILEGVQDILFPGYYGVSDLCWDNVKYFIGGKVDELFVKLSLEIAKSVRHECTEASDVCDTRMDESEKRAVEFFIKIPELREILASDVAAAYDGDPAAKSPDEIIFSYPGMFAITTYRIAHELHIQGIPLLPRIMTEHAHGETGIDIHPGATIGRSFFIDHGTGVVIGETSEIGDRVRLYHGVTLGALSVPRDSSGSSMRGKKRHPTIEDDVTIYPGATILGGETVVGKGSVIGGNILLLESVPPGTRITIEKSELRYKTRPMKLEIPAS